jgi:hypothetical protein
VDKIETGRHLPAIGELYQDCIQPPALDQQTAKLVVPRRVAGTERVFAVTPNVNHHSLSGSFG